MAEMKRRPIAWSDVACKKTSCQELSAVSLEEYEMFRNSTLSELYVADNF